MVDYQVKERISVTNESETVCSAPKRYHESLVKARRKGKEVQEEGGNGWGEK